MARLRFVFILIFTLIYSALMAQSTIKGTLVDSLNRDKLFYVSFGHGDGTARGVENSHAITSPHPSAPNFHFGELFLNELHHADSTAANHLYEVNS